MITNTFIESSEARPGWTNPSLIREILRGLNLISPDGSIQITQSGEGVALQASAGGGGIPVRIYRVHPDSPTGANDVHMFQGSVFGNGSEENATKNNETIRIMGIAPGVDSYPETVRFAAKTTQTWTDKNGTDVKETVYEIEDPGNGAYLVKIFGLHGDSPTSGQRMFYGSVYEDGSGSPPTASNQTIRILGLADDIEEYPSFPINAIRILQTWTGATQSHTEYVYEATAPVLWGQT